MADMGSSAKVLEHLGVVSAIDGKVVEVEFGVESACVECRAKDLCTKDGERRFVPVWEPNAEYFSVGEQVMISVSETMGIKAAVWAYIVPVFVVLGALLGGNWARLGDAVTGLGALGALAVYYIVLWFFRKRIEKEIVFKIRKI